MGETRWTFDSIPDQGGRVAVVTGANTGIGLETARMLAQKGADVVLACRSPDRGRAAQALIEAERPKGRVSVAPLDLADLASVASFARDFLVSHDRLDLLVLNAAVMDPPRSRTRQGFELQFGTNHLGHFALTGHLLGLVLATRDARIVVVSSVAHRRGRIALDDLDWERRRYVRHAAYSQSKLANLMFALELHRRLPAGSSVRVTAAHPGFTRTELQRTSAAKRLMSRIWSMTPAEGALPTLRAATDPEAMSGSYWGPAGWLELVGPPVPARIHPRAKDPVVAARLFELSERLTGVPCSPGPSRTPTSPP